MLQLNHDKKALLYSFVFVLILFSIVLFPGNTVHAAKELGYYSYDNIHKMLSEEHQTSEYIYKLNNIPYICFAKYKGNDYKMTVKRTVGVKDYLYCMDYSKHVDFDKNFAAKNDLFNNTLRARLAIAFYYGASEWKGLANSKFTTNNSILDYYMTQVVVHALIYKYGDDKSNYGLDYNQITFKSGTGNLSKKTEAFYKFCCEATVYANTTDFSTFNFRFVQQDSPYFYLENDILATPVIACSTGTNNSTVIEFVRRISSASIDSDVISVENTGSTYDSSCQIKIPISIADSLTPGVHVVSLSESVGFNRYLAGVWQSTDKEHISQEIGGLLTDSKSAQDEIAFSLLIGNVTLHKRDSITGETISDAVFQLQQFDDTIGQYVFYKHLGYNSFTQQYESGNIYLSSNNKNGKFRLIEEAAGANYINDWDGAEFQITQDIYSYSFDVENQPILGRLRIHKSGENLSFSDSEFSKADDIPLAGVKFGLYAKEDIYLKGAVFYPKDKKIADMITDATGSIFVDNLISGQYYFREEETNPLYVIDPDIHFFEIIRNSEGQYNEVSQPMINKLKACQIRIFKYYYDKSDSNEQKKLPIKGARFGLYAAGDIRNALGQTILEKDTLVKEAVSDQEGYILFDNLPYGDYYIKELEAPEDFILNDGIVAVSTKDFQYNDTQGVYYCEKDILNQKQKFKIHINKTGERITGFTREISEQGDYVRYQLQPQALQNVEFSLYNKEDDSLVAKAVTDEQGIAEFTDIEPGYYYAMESAAPGEYQLSDEKIFFECKVDSRDYNPLTPPVFTASMDNQLCNCNIQIFKSGEYPKVDKKGLNYEQIPLSGVIFGIYQSFEYDFSSGEKLPQDSCVGYIVTDPNGNGILTEKLPMGTYYLKEIKTNADYELDMNTYPFEIKHNNNQDISIQVGDGNRFVNQLSKSSVEIIKTDANTGKKLKNVEFTLYNDKDEKIGVYRTNRQGKIVVDQLPYGKYYFIETKCKNGYYSSNNKYRFELVSADRVTLNITNNPILQLGFAEHYKEGLIGCLVVIIALFKAIASGHGRYL